MLLFTVLNLGYHTSWLLLTLMWSPVFITRSTCHCSRRCGLDVCPRRMMEIPPTDMARKPIRCTEWRVGFFLFPWTTAEVRCVLSLRPIISYRSWGRASGKLCYISHQLNSFFSFSSLACVWTSIMVHQSPLFPRFPHTCTHKSQVLNVKWNKLPWI